MIDMDGSLKIADFGLSKMGMKANEMAYTYCGSPEYMAPEMLNKYSQYNSESDTATLLTITVWEPCYTSW